MSDLLTPLRDRRTRKWVVVVLLLFGVVVAAAIFLISLSASGDAAEAWRELGLQIAIGIFVALATAGFLAVLAAAVNNRQESLDEIVVLSPADTKAAHLRELETTDFWYHDGHIGRWVRAIALPRLKERAMSQLSPRTVVILILDPRDDKICDKYAEYRKNLGRERADISHLDDTRAHLIATCVGAAMHNDRLHPAEVYFKNWIEFSRMDLGSSVAFWTLSDPKCNAVALRHDPASQRRSFYDAAKQSFEAARERAERFHPVSVPVTVSEQTVRKFVDDNGLLASPASPRLIKKVVALVNDHSTPFD